MTDVRDQSSDTPMAQCQSIALGRERDASAATSQQAYGAEAEPNVPVSRWSIATLSRQTALVVSGKMVGAGLSFVISLLVARWLGPEDFGLFSLFIVILILGNDVLGEGLNPGVVRYYTMYCGSKKMDDVPEGVVGVITSHSWLDSPTLRGMRQSLMGSFDRIYVLDLHGNFLKKERTPEGDLDQNVFDIKQGVAISLFVKKPGVERGIWRGDFWGRQLRKYQEASSRTLADVDWAPLTPASPMYLLIHQDADRRSEYEQGMPLPKIFSSGGRE